MSTDRRLQLAGAAHSRLLRDSQTFATAESLTGGLLAEAITAVPGVSATYVGGVVAYATRLKVDLLGVEEQVIDRCGVVSAECAVAMAAGARARLGSDWAIATTGVAGPTQQDGHPVGTVFVAVAGPGGAQAQALHLEGDRGAIRSQTCVSALSLLLARLEGEQG